MCITYYNARDKEKIMECSDVLVPRVGEFVSLHPNPAQWKVEKVVYTYEANTIARYTNPIKAVDVYIRTDGLGY